jgi:hypothetical protein
MSIAFAPDEELAKPDPDEWADEPQRLRAYVLDLLASPEIDGTVLATNCDIVWKWLTDGTLPANGRKPHFRAAT